MGCIQVREGEGIVNFYDLDDCGRPNIADNAKLVLTTVSELTWEDSIDEGQQVKERNFAGKKCYTDAGCDELQWVQVGITTCGMIPALDNLLLASNPKTSGGNVVGFGRVDLDCQAAVALEVLIQLDAESCTATETVEPPVFGMLFPLVKGWRPSGGGSLNGQNLIKPQYSGKGYKNPLLAAGGTSNNLLPSDLSHWQGVWNAAEWYTVTLFDDGATIGADGFDALLASADCEPQEFVGVT